MQMYECSSFQTECSNHTHKGCYSTFKIGGDEVGSGCTVAFEIMKGEKTFRGRESDHNQL